MAFHYDRVLSLFVECNKVRQLCHSMTRQAAKVQEISMNAAIVSRHTGASSRVFSEIAMQIGKNSKLLGLGSRKILDQINEITSLSLQLLVQVSIIESYRRASQTIHGRENRELVLDRVRLRETELAERVERIRDRSLGLVAEFRSVDHIHNRTWMNITRFKIEANYATPDEEQLVQPICESLEAALTDSVAMGKKLFEGITTLQSGLSFDTKTKGELHAA